MKLLGFVRVVRPLEALATVALVVAATPSWARQYTFHEHLFPVVVAPLCLALAGNIAAEIRPLEGKPRALGLTASIALAIALYVACVVAVVGHQARSAVFVLEAVTLSIAHALLLKRVVVLGSAVAALLVAFMIPWSRLAISASAGALIGPAISAFVFVLALELLETALDPTTTPAISRDGCVALFSGLAIVGALYTVIIAFIAPPPAVLARVLACLMSAGFAYGGARASFAHGQRTLLRIVPVLKGSLLVGIAALALS